MFIGKKKCRIYDGCGVSQTCKARKEAFVADAKPYLTKKDEKQIDTTYDTTYTIDRRHKDVEMG